MFSVPVGPSICRWLCYVATRGVENVDKYVFDKGSVNVLVLIRSTVILSHLYRGLQYHHVFINTKCVFIPLICSFS
jgi:hypothetical protein